MHERGDFSRAGRAQLKIVTLDRGRFQPSTSLSPKPLESGTFANLVHRLIFYDHYLRQLQMIPSLFCFTRPCHSQRQLGHHSQFIFSILCAKAPASVTSEVASTFHHWNQLHFCYFTVVILTLHNLHSCFVVYVHETGQPEVPGSWSGAKAQPPVELKNNL